MEQARDERSILSKLRTTLEVKKENWEQSNSNEAETNELTLEEQQEVQSVLEALGRLLKKPAVEKYVKAALGVAFAPTNLMAAGFDEISDKIRAKIIPKGPQVKPGETDSADRSED